MAVQAALLKWHSKFGVVYTTLVLRSYQDWEIIMAIYHTIRAILNARGEVKYQSTEYPPGSYQPSPPVSLALVFGPLFQK